MPPYDLDVRDHSYRAIRSVDPRARLARLIPELTEHEAAVVLHVVRRLEIHREFERARRRP